MKAKPHVVTPGDREAALDVIGVNVTVLVSDAQSKSLNVTFQTGDEGRGPPPHHHAWDESFFVTKGEVLFTVDGHTTRCPAGTCVYVPAHTIHGFAFGPGGGEMIEMTGAGSGAIRMFGALDREIPPGSTDVPKIVRVAGENGVMFHLG